MSERSGYSMPVRTRGRPPLGMALPMYLLILAGIALVVMTVATPGAPVTPALTLAFGLAASGVVGLAGLKARVSRSGRDGPSRGGPIAVE